MKTIKKENSSGPCFSQRTPSLHNLLKDNLPVFCLPTFFCASFSSFLCPVHPTLPSQFPSPKSPLSGTSDLLFLVEKRQLAGAGFGDGSGRGCPTGKKKKENPFSWRATKGESCVGVLRCYVVCDGEHVDRKSAHVVCLALHSLRSKAAPLVLPGEPARKDLLDEAPLLASAIRSLKHLHRYALATSSVDAEALQSGFGVKFFIWSGEVLENCPAMFQQMLPANSSR